MSTFILAAATSMGEAVPISVRAGITKEDVFVNESFAFIILIDEYDQPAQVDIDPLQPWSPKYVGGQPRSSSRTIISNGQSRTTVEKEYRMTYRLTSTQEGAVTLPPVNVIVEGKTYRTNLVNVNVLKPGATDRLALEMTLSEPQCYVGQPVTMTLHWYSSVSIGDFRYHVPALEDTENFFIEKVSMPPGAGGQVGTLPLDGQVAARQYAGRHNGKQCNIISFSTILIPKKPGVLAIGAPSVSCDVEIGNGNQRRSPFGFGFDLFRDRQYRRYSCAAQPASLNVIPLPQEGKPDDFAGLVGHYSISTGAEPTDSINVGDPVTLTISIGGELLERVSAPNLLQILEITDNFKVPGEQSAPELKGARKVFVQTLRPTNNQVSEIAAIPISFFDVDQGRYVTQWSDPIPLDIVTTRTVTADQAIGLQGATVQASHIEAIEQGIAANYDGPQLYENASFSPLLALRQPAYLFLWAAPLLLLLASALVRLTTGKNLVRQKKKRAAAAGKNARRRLSRLAADANADADDFKNQITDTFRQYIADRYDKSARSLTAQDCAAILRQDQCDESTVDCFRQIMEACEQSRYAGGAATGVLNVQDLNDVIKSLEKNVTARLPV